MDSSRNEIMSNPLYGELLRQQSATITETRAHIERLLTELEERKGMCLARRTLLNTFRKDVTEGFTDCRTQVKKSVATMVAYLKQQQDDMLRELDDTAQYNLETIEQQAVGVDRALLRLDQQLEEGQSLLREQDTFLFFSKGNLYKQLPLVPVPVVQLQFKDTFPDLTALSLQPFQAPLQHAVQVDVREFLKSPNDSRICGNIFHNGFRFQIQLKHDQQHLSVYLCLRAWHDVAAFLRVTVNFALSLSDGPDLIHTATAKNTFSGRHDGWGWNKYVPVARLHDCTDVLFTVHFNELSYAFIQDDGRNTSVEMDTSGDQLLAATSPVPRSLQNLSLS